MSSISKALRLAKGGKIPRTHNPGKGAPKEKAIYVNAAEEEIIKRALGHAGKMTKKGVRSFTDPSQSYGGDLSGNQTTDNNNGSGSSLSNNDNSSSDSASSRSSNGNNFSTSTSTGGGGGGFVSENSGSNAGDSFGGGSSGAGQGSGFSNPTSSNTNSQPAGLAGASHDPTAPANPGENRTTAGLSPNKPSDSPNYPGNNAGSVTGSAIDPVTAAVIGSAINDPTVTPAEISYGFRPVQTSQQDDSVPNASEMLAKSLAPSTFPSMPMTLDQQVQALQKPITDRITTDGLPNPATYTAPYSDPTAGLYSFPKQFDDRTPDAIDPETIQNYQAYKNPSATVDTYTQPNDALTSIVDGILQRGDQNYNPNGPETPTDPNSLGYMAPFADRPADPATPQATMPSGMIMGFPAAMDVINGLFENKPVADSSVTPLAGLMPQTQMPNLQQDLPTNNFGPRINGAPAQTTVDTADPYSYDPLSSAGYMTPNPDQASIGNVPTIPDASPFDRAMSFIAQDVQPGEPPLPGSGVGSATVSNSAAKTDSTNTTVSPDPTFSYNEPNPSTVATTADVAGLVAAMMAAKHKDDVHVSDVPDIPGFSTMAMGPSTYNYGAPDTTSSQYEDPNSTKAQSMLAGGYKSYPSGSFSDPNISGGNSYGIASPTAYDSGQYADWAHGALGVTPDTTTSTSQTPNMTVSDAEAAMGLTGQPHVAPGVVALSNYPIIRALNYIADQIHPYVNPHELANTGSSFLASSNGGGNSTGSTGTTTAVNGGTFESALAAARSAYAQNPNQSTQYFTWTNPDTGQTDTYYIGNYRSGGKVKDNNAISNALRMSMV